MCIMRIFQRFSLCWENIRRICKQNLLMVFGEKTCKIFYEYFADNWIGCQFNNEIAKFFIFLTIFLATRKINSKLKCFSKILFKFWSVLWLLLTFRTNTIWDWSNFSDLLFRTANHSRPSNAELRHYLMLFVVVKYFLALIQLFADSWLLSFIPIKNTFPYNYLSN